MFGLQLGRLGIAGSLWSERALWPLGAASPGMRIDGPSYPAACWQDSAGTTALSTVGTVLDSSNPVGLVLDRKAGATSKTDPGLHLSQATSAARPVASARKNLLVGTATLSTQSVTVTAIPHTITFSGGGTVTASGAYTGALTNGQTFTPTAGTLTLTVSGTVTSAQLERGSAATTYQAVVSASDYTAAGFPVFAKFDGVDDALGTATFPAGTLTSSMDLLAVVQRDPDSGNSIILTGVSNGVNSWALSIGLSEPSATAACIGCGSPTMLVDNAVVPLLASSLRSALLDGRVHIVEFRGLNLASWTTLVASPADYKLKGKFGSMYLFASGQDANRDKARARMAAYFGVTLA